MWKFSGQQRPDFALEPAQGQESVWDYPRPPALAACSNAVEVRNGATLIASSGRSMRVLETASPPTVYLPPDDISMQLLTRVAGNSYCEWKGSAVYWGLAIGGQPVAWSYPEPTAAFAAIRDWLCFYPGRIECYLDGGRVRPQPGRFYGGWVTDAIVGPFKGEPGTGHW